MWVEHPLGCVIAHARLGPLGHERAFPDFPHGVSMKKELRARVYFARNSYICKRKGHSKRRDSANRNFYEELEPPRRRAKFQLVDIYNTCMVLEEKYKE